MTKIRFYMASAIRGRNGNDATIDEINANVGNAINQVAYLRKQLPGGEFYCPAEHEVLFTGAWLQGLVHSADILHQSKAIVRMSDVPLIMTDPKWSGGIRAEMEEANRCDLPIIPLYTVPENDWPIVIAKTIGNYPRLDVVSLQWTGPESPCKRG